MNRLFTPADQMSPARALVVYAGGLLVGSLAAIALIALIIAATPLS